MTDLKAEKIVVKVPDNYLERLSSTYYEVEADKEIVTTLLRQDANCHTDNFVVFKNDYKQAIKDYENAKNDFEINFVKDNYPDAKSWYVTFNNGMVEITI